MKENTYNEWFQPIKRGKCSSCDASSSLTSIFARGKYVRGKWRLMRYFCRSCFFSYIVPDIKTYMMYTKKNPIGNARHGYKIPDWLSVRYAYRSDK